MLEIYWTSCLENLLLLPTFVFPFANYYQGLDFGLLQWFSFQILSGKLARGRPEFTPLRMLERFTAVDFYPNLTDREATSRVNSSV